MKTVLSDYIRILQPDEPFIIKEFSILDAIFKEGIVYRQSAWFQYLPLTTTVYSQPFGWLDSNCYHIFSGVEKLSQSLNFIHYDCLDYDQMKITKIIKFIGNDNQQYNFEFNIDIFDYENQWYYFEFILFPYNNRFQIMIIKNEQLFKNEVLNVLPYKDGIILQKIGGDLIVVDSKLVSIEKGDKFASFRGQIIPISNNNNIFNFFQSAISLAQYSKVCKCQNIPINNVIDTDYNYLDRTVFNSKFKNCNSFIFSGWVKINEIIQNDQEMIFQFIKLSSNVQNAQFQNQNLSPLQLFYKLSLDSNEIIITTYSYTFPSVTIDFTTNPFLITKVFKILNNIKLWHLLYVKLLENQLDINIKFFQNKQIYEHKTQIIVQQFHQIFFKLILGNIQQSTNNYLNMMSRNIYFFNCNNNFQQQNCHTSCGECDGPTYQDCLSCSIESQRIYLLEYKQCICPYNTIDENNQCLSYLDLNFQLIENLEENKECIYGQFELNGVCYQCPSKLNSQTVYCLECVLNPKEWYKRPICQTYLYLDNNGRTSELQKEFLSYTNRKYYIFNGIDLELCLDCQELSLTNLDNVNKDLFIKTQSFKGFCSTENSSEQCFQCSINNCKLCAIYITKEICIVCYGFSFLVDGQCTEYNYFNFKENYCLSPYYLTSNKECRKCPIDNCIYCFEYVVDDLKLTTLYKNYQVFNGDDNIQVGCAMCKEGYVFDFRIGLCLNQAPKIEFCLRSYINQEGSEKCTLSSSEDFSVAREIVNCEKYINNCLQCFLTIQSILRCIICKEGYTTSTTEVNGQCNISKRSYSKISIEGNYLQKDAWVQRIQSFIGSFLSNSYYYELSSFSYQIDEIAISCIEGYQLAQKRYCVKYCDANCLECQLNFVLTEYLCNKCPLNYYKKNQRVQANGICQTCSNLCSFCQSRNLNDITQISSNFIQTQDNEVFSKQCYLPIQDKNIIIQPQQFISIYCLNKSCKNNLLYQFQNVYCNSERFLINSLTQKTNLNYFNQVGVKKIIIQIEIPNNTNCSSGIQIDSLAFKQNIFSLQETGLILNGNYQLFKKITYEYQIENFDSIVMHNITMILNNYPLNFGNTRLKLTMKNIIFIGQQEEQKTLFINTSQLSNIQLVNITISNASFSGASFFQLDSLEFSEQVYIQQLLIQNSIFLNSNLFSILNSQISIYIQKLQIENCSLINSSIINMKLNLSLQNSTQISRLVMKNCTLKQSYLLYFMGYININIYDLIVQGNSLLNSSLLASSYNTSIIDALIEDNFLDQSRLIITNDLNITGYILFNINQIKVQDLILKNSNLFQLSAYYLFQNLIIQMNNLLFVNVQRLDNLNYQNYIFKISRCSQCSIKEIEIKNIENITTLFFQQSDKILIENFLFQQENKKNKVHYSQQCKQQLRLQNQLIQIQGFSQLKLQKGEIIDCQLVDSKIIQIVSTFQDQTNNIEQIEIKDVIFKRNIIEQNQESMLSLLTIYSEKKQIIKIQNLSFINNFFHQYEDNPNENSAGLIYIYSTQSEMEMDNILCQENAITNSSASFINIISQSIFLNNYIINNHNIINYSLWSQFYKLEIDQEYNQDQINQIIQQIYPINVKGGAAIIIAQQFICTNSIFQNIMTLSSAIFDIRTQGFGVIKFNNITSNLISSAKRDINENSGCITINSQNSNLDLDISNSNFNKVSNIMGTALITIKPSKRITKIQFKQIQIINCFSFFNQIFYIQFSTYNDQHLNQLQIRNMSIIFEEKEWIIFISKFGQLSQTEIAQIIDDNSILNVFGGEIYINQFQIQGIIISPIFKIQNSIKLIISQCYINDVQSFYRQSLIILNLPQQAQILFEKVEIQRFSIYQLNMEQLQQTKISQFRVAGCQLQQISQLSIFNSKTIINENIKQLVKATEKINYQLIQIQSSNSQSKLIFKNVKLIQNSCLKSTLRLFVIVLSNFKILRIDDYQCFYNQIYEYGCLYIRTDEQNSKQQVLISNSQFIQNNGSQGTGLMVENINLIMYKCNIIGNYALEKGGGMKLNLSKIQIHIYESIVMLNRAKVGGGIYFQQQNNLNQDNFKNSFLNFNYAEDYANNVVESPTHLSVDINQMEMKSEKQYNGNQTIFTLLIKPYIIIEQGQKIKVQHLMIPSNQKINNYKIYIPKFQIFRTYIEEISIHFKNSFNENLDDQVNSSCVIEATINFEDKKVVSSEKMIQSLFYNYDSKGFDLSSLSFSFDPYFQENKILSIELNCQAALNEMSLQYYIYAKTLKCQQGEFYVEKGCQVCQSNQGFYSVTYNTTKCSIFDIEKFENITSNKIKLLEGFWRPNYLSDYTERCIKNEKFCSGGWDVGNNLCSQGHKGGLCEECDNFDIRGDGMFYKNLQSSQCFGCNNTQDSILPFVLTSIWSIISILITLRSIEKSNRLFSSLKIRQKFSKIIFKLDQDHESILIKMLLNYLWIFSVIFTFNTNFSFSINFIELTSNSSYFMANNLDCYLSQLQSLELIYIRIITMLILIAIQLLIIWFGFKFYAVCKNWNFNKSIISNTVLYLYVSNYAALVKQLCSILSKREISNIAYIQGDVSLAFGTQTHLSWIFGFAIPCLGVIGILIPFSLFFLMYINREQLDQIKLRRHICYLFNEYNSESYYWEQIKLSKKTIIIIILTYFESNVLLTASLLGLCLLFYQLLAVKQKPYIIQSLNFLDIQTGQICSISIFISAAKYVAEQENSHALSIILQIFIILLCIRLCYPFIINIFRVYFKKYKLLFIQQLYKLFRSIKADCCISTYLNSQLKKLNFREQRKRTNFTKLRCHLIQISKLQIGHQKQRLLISRHMISLITSQSTLRYRQTVTITDVEMNKLISSP